MTRASQRALALGASIAVGAGLLSGCTSTPRQPVTQQGVVPAGEFRLLAFDSCETALTSLREAASATVGPYGLPGMYGYRTAVRAGEVMPDMAMDGVAGAPAMPQAEAGKGADPA